MSEQASVIRIEKCEGDVHIHVYEGSDVVDEDGHGYTRSSDGSFNFDTEEDLHLHVPHGSRLLVERVAGDATIDGLPSIEIVRVDGDLRAAGISESCQVGRVGGDARLERVANVSIEAVGGDFKATELSGALRMSSVGGDCTIQGSVNTISPMNVGGDVKLRTTWTPDQDYRLTVGGDVSIDVGEEPNLVLSATVGGDVEGLIRQGPGIVSVTWGSGAARLEMTIGGDLRVRGGKPGTHDSFSSEEWGDAIRDFTEELVSMGREIRDQFSTFGRDWGQRRSEEAGERARHAAERAAERAAAAAERMRVRLNDREIRFAPERIERLKEQARRAAEEGISRAQEAIERALGGLDWGNHPHPPHHPNHPHAPPRPPRPPRPFSPSRPERPVHPSQRINISDESGDHAAHVPHAAPANDQPFPQTGPTVQLHEDAAPAAPASPAQSASDRTQERLAILRMVEAGKITVEEAGLLLEALN